MSRIPGDRNYVASRSAHDDDAISLIIPRARVGRRGQIDIYRLHAGAGKVIHLYGIRSSKRVEPDHLHFMTIHGDGGYVTSERQPLTISGKVDFFAHVRSIEEH